MVSDFARKTVSLIFLSAKTDVTMPSGVGVRAKDNSEKFPLLIGFLIPLFLAY
jgi:hypothetical protein